MILLPLFFIYLFIFIFLCYFTLFYVFASVLVLPLCLLFEEDMCFSCCHSAGKSFVAEILMLRRVITTGKMALLVLPYVSICAEKVLFWLANMLKFRNYIFCYGAVGFILWGSALKYF